MSEAELTEEVRKLRVKLEIAIQQRDGFARNYHDVTRVPFQERHEIIEDCNAEIERIDSSKTSRTND